MEVKEALKAISSGNYELELSIDNKVPGDVVIFGTFTDKEENAGGFSRFEFSLRGEDQKEFLIGLAKIINEK